MQLVAFGVGLVAALHIVAAAVIFYLHLSPGFGEKEAAFQMRLVALGVFDMGVLLLGVAALVAAKAPRP